MRKFTLFALVGLLLGACSSTGKYPQESRLYAQYVQYASLLNRNQDSAAIEFLSERNIADLTTNASVVEFRTHFPVVSTINEVFSKETGTFEETQADIGCLTIIGFDESSEPTSMNIEYAYERGAWKIDYIQVVFHEKAEQLPKTTVCPTRAPR